MFRVIALLAALLISGCRQDMATQPSVRPLRPTPFFGKDPSQQQPVRGTVARGQLNDDDHLHRGRMPGARLEVQSVAAMVAFANPLAVPFAAGHSASAALVSTGPFVREFPFPITQAVLTRGQVQYGVFCAVCHDAVGTGAGMIVRRGYTRPPSYHVPRLREAPAGYLFDVITHGFGAMPDHASQIDVADRWAIVAYLRVLQRSQHASLDDVPADRRDELKGGTP